MYAVVPAHDEAPTVGAVVRALVESRALTGVVVVDDGSADDTAARAEQAGAFVVRLSRNVGKGEAMHAGIARLDKLGDRSDRVVFMDADLVGLTPDHVRRLVALSDRGYDQVAGILYLSPMTALFTLVMPIMSGQRVVSKWVLRALPKTCWNGYSIETAMNDVVDQYDGRTATVLLPGVSQRSRFEKRGFFSALRSSFRMTKQVRATQQALADSGGTSCAT